MLPPPLRTLLRRARRGMRAESGPCSGYSKLSPGEAAPGSRGWQAAAAAEAQRRAFAPLLEQLRAGQPRADFTALAWAFAQMELSCPTVFEVGCGHGWNFEVLTRLWGRPFSYTGMDISPPMLRLGHAEYHAARFVAGDGHRLPFADASCDVLLSGTVLMHLADPALAIAESARVTRRWCVLHTVPLVHQQPTVYLRKPAYGGETVEVLLNEDELRGLLARHGLKIVNSAPSLEYDVRAVVGEPTPTRTYVCVKG